MRLAHLSLVLLVALATVLAEPAMAAPAAEPPARLTALTLGMPPDTDPNNPLRVLVALHGMGDTGESFARSLVEEANRNHWLLVAPTIEYGDWTDPAQIAREEPMLIQSLSYLLDALPARTGVPTQPRVLLIGFSRGAQLAHRFAEFHPDRVSAVASLSAGTYTLPATSAGFPFGLRDLARYTGQIFDAARFHDVPFWVGVGADDTNPADLPHQWDRFLGSTRVDRARSFQAALRAAGARATLVRFAGTPHALTGEMISSACAFLVGQDLVSF